MLLVLIYLGVVTGLESDRAVMSIAAISTLYTILEGVLDRYLFLLIYPAHLQREFKLFVLFSVNYI